MKKTLLTLALAIMALTGASFAQQGLLKYNFPRGTAGVWYLCTASQSASACAASPLAATWDAAGNSSITQTSGVTFNAASSEATNGISIYAAPQIAQLEIVYSTPSDAGTQMIPVVVVPDVGGNAALNDGYYSFPAPQNCMEAASANAGSGDGTIVLDGAVPALKGILSASGNANLVFTCQLQLPSRITSAKGAVINDITFNYAVVTNTLDSWAATLKSFTGPAAAQNQTPASATLATFGGALGLSSFTGNGAVSAAGSYYSQKINVGTPVQVADHQVLILQLTGAHAAANAITVTIPTITIHYTVPLI